jgi:hypothetical protein
VPLGAANNLPNSFNVKNESAGEKWLKGFLKRRSEFLSVRLPHGISTAHVKSFIKENVNTFFDALEPELKKMNFNPNRLYNRDETLAGAVQHKNTKVITIKGKRAVACLTSAQRGCLIAVVTRMDTHSLSLCTTFGDVSSEEFAGRTYRQDATCVCLYLSYIELDPD